MEEEVKGQSKAAEVERTKRIDAARTLKASETDFAKAREDLKEAARARDSATASFTGAKSRPRNRQSAYSPPRINCRLLRSSSAI